MTLFVFFATATRTWVIATDDRETRISSGSIIWSDRLGDRTMLSVEHRYCYTSLIGDTCTLGMSCLSSLEIAREE
jgi:hypothetical protein